MGWIFKCDIKVDGCNGISSWKYHISDRSSLRITFLYAFEIDFVHCTHCKFFFLFGHVYDCERTMTVLHFFSLPVKISLHEQPSFKSGFMLLWSCIFKRCFIWDCTLLFASFKNELSVTWLQLHFTIKISMGTDGLNTADMSLCFFFMFLVSI